MKQSVITSWSSEIFLREIIYLFSVPLIGRGCQPATTLQAPRRYLIRVLLIHRVIKEHNLYVNTHGSKYIMQDQWPHAASFAPFLFNIIFLQLHSVSSYTRMYGTFQYSKREPGKLLLSPTFHFRGIACYVVNKVRKLKYLILHSPEQGEPTATITPLRHDGLNLSLL